MKKSNYSVLLIYDENIAQSLKKGMETDKITIVTLNNKVVKSVDFVTTAEELKTKLQ